jgi:hypothetical protein
VLSLSNLEVAMTDQKLKWLWHEPSNVMCIADLSGGLPLITVCDDDVAMINPFYSYPYKCLLEHFGFVEIGEL